MAMRVTSEALAPGEHYKVLLDGEDVSHRCVMADDRSGEVALVGAEGFDMSTGEDVPIEIRRGKVTIYPMHESVFGIDP